MWPSCVKPGATLLERFLVQEHLDLERPDQEAGADDNRRDTSGGSGAVVPSGRSVVWFN